MQSRLGTSIGAASVCAVLAATVFLSGCKARASSAQMPPPPEVGVAAVISHPVRAWDEFNGRVSAVDAVEVRSRVSGYVDRVAFREGSEVKRGDLLFIIDPRPYQVALDSALAQLERANAAAKLAEIQAQRASTLIAAKAISREEMDNRSADLSRANADLHAAQAAVATAKLNLGFTEIRAPISGRIGRAEMTVGNLAQADQSMLTTIVSQDPVYVYFDCDEQSFLHYLALKRTGDAANTARVELSGESGFPHAGTVDFLDNQVNPATGTIRARVVLHNTERTFTPGLYAHVRFEDGGQFNAMLIDDKAVLTDQDRKYVYVVGPGNKALRKDIVPGRLIDGLRVVQSGLDTSDKVVVTGMQKIFFPGMPVVPKNISKDAATAAPSVAMQ